MGVIGQQTIKLFEQFTSDEPVEILHWTTNLTFETIGKVGFGYGKLYIECGQHSSCTVSHDYI